MSNASNTLPNSSASLSGSILSGTRILEIRDDIRSDVDKPFLARHIGHASTQSKAAVVSTILTIILSAILFVTVISVFDVIKSLITVSTAPDDLITSIIFMVLCLLIAIPLTIIITFYLQA